MLMFQWRNDHPVSYPYKWFASYGYLKEDCCGFKKKDTDAINTSYFELIQQLYNVSSQWVAGWGTAGLEVQEQQSCWVKRAKEWEKEQERLTQRSSDNSSWPACVKPDPLFRTFIATCLPDLKHTHTHTRKNLWWPTQTSSDNITTQVTQRLIQITNNIHTYCTWGPHKATR